MSFLGFGVTIQSRDAHEARELEVASGLLTRGADVEQRSHVAARGMEIAMNGRPCGVRGEEHEVSAAMDDVVAFPARGERSIAGLSVQGAHAPARAAGEGGREEFRLIA
jgi:hypothetical protein